MLAFGRKQVVNLQPLDLNRLIGENQDMLQRLVREDIQIDTRLDPDLGTTMADPGQLHQVLMNLSANSRYAMPKGGLLTISTANVDADQACTAEHPGIGPGPYRGADGQRHGHRDPKRHSGADLRSVFHDQARRPGIRAGAVDGLWDRAAERRGDLRAQRTWARRRFRYLAAPDSTGMDTVESAQRRARSAAQTILVVEDQNPVRTVAATTLAKAGYRMLEAASPDRTPIAAHRTPRTPSICCWSGMIMPGIRRREFAERMPNWQSSGDEGALHVR